MNVHDHFLNPALEMPPTWAGMETGMEEERIHPKGAPGLLFQQSSPSWYPVCIQAAQATA